MLDLNLQNLNRLFNLYKLVFKLLIFFLKYVLIIAINWIEKSSNDETVKIWDVTTGECIKNLTGHEFGASSTSFNSQDLLAVGAYVGTVKIWDVTSGECIQNLTGHGENGVTSVSFNSHGLLASSAFDNTVKIWNFV